jgi:hypothetical protein
MALQIRRGLESQRENMTPPLAEGELAFVTDYLEAEVSPLWIGDNNLPGGIPIAPVLKVNGLPSLERPSPQVQLYTSDITEDEGEVNNLWFREDRAQDAAASLFTTTTTASTSHVGISFAYNDSSGKIVASVTPTVNSGTANALAYYASNGTVVSGSSDRLTWDNAASLLTVSSGTLEVIANNGPRSLLNLRSSYNGSTANAVTMTKSRGSYTSPTALLNGDSLGVFDFSGYDGTNFITSARISAFISKTVSTGVLPSGVGINTTNSSGELELNFRVLDTGQTVIGPGPESTTGTGQLSVISTVNPQTALFNNSAVSINTIFDGVDGQNVSFGRSRGNRVTQTAVQQGDEIIDLAFFGYDGSQNLLSSQITAGVEGTITTGRVPGNLIFRTANTNGVATRVLKISAPSTSSVVGVLSVNGTIETTSTPATFWNYDSSASTLTLTTGGTVNFSNFSGSVLVNCHNSGTVTQYLCGGGGSGATEIGSSKVGLPTGTMADNSGISGYTFTATETGIHSFYVIRTRTVA